MYLDIEEQLNQITDGLKQELLAANAIDETGHAIDINKFNEIIDKKIKLCNEILLTTEKDGVTKDLYGANIANTRIERLHKMKETGTLVPEAIWQGREDIPEKATSGNKKPGAFRAGISKIFAKFQSALGLQKTSENNR